MDEIDILFSRMATSRQVFTDRLLEAKAAKGPTYFEGFDADADRNVVSGNSGDRRVVQGSVTNGYMQPGQTVKSVGRGLNTRIDSMPRVKPQTVAPAVAIAAESAVPILFTKLNSEGDREYWLGGDRDEPLLLDTFAPLSLITNDWMNGSTIVSAPSRSISGAFSATTTSGGFSQGLFYSTTVSLNIPTYVLAKLTGTLTTDLHMSASASTFVFGLAVSQIDDRIGESVAATETEVVTANTLGGISTTLNQGGMLLLAPSNLEIYLDINIATNYSDPIFGGVGIFSPPSTGTLDVTATYEFIPCYLSATATKRFVLLQPAPGVLAYYEIEADSNDFSKTSFAAPDPVATDSEDWRSPFASHVQLTPPFNLGTPCENPYLFEYAPNTQLVSDIPFTRYAANIVDSSLARIDGFQDGDYSKLYQRFQAITGGTEVLYPLVNTEDVELDIDVSTLEVSGASCTIGTPETQTVTARSLNTPDAILLAIAPVVVE